ncbi:MAG: ABC transporter substrate-binding protein [Bacillota bacterium]
MESFKRLVAAGLVAMMVLGVAGCGAPASSGNQPAAPGTPATPKAPDEIKVAIVEPLTGLAAEIGTRAANGAEQAIEEINANGGIKALGGAKLKAVRYDTQSKPDVGISQTEAAIKSGCVAIIGCAQSAVGMVVTQVAERNKVPILVTVAQLDDITNRGFKYTFSVTPTTSQINGSLLNYVQTLKHPTTGNKLRIAHVYEDTTYGQGAQKWLEANAKNYSVEFVGSASYPAKASDVTSVLSKVKAMNADFLLISSYLQDAVLIMRTAKDLRLNALGIQDSSGDQEEFAKMLGPIADYVYFNMYWSPESRIPGAEADRGKKVNQTHKDKYGEEASGFAMLGHTAAYVLKSALEKAASTDGEALRKALAETNLTGGDGIIMPVKTLKFDDKGRNIEAGVLVGQVLEGKRGAIWPADFATVQPVFPMPSWEKRGL